MTCSTSACKNLFKTSYHAIPLESVRSTPLWCTWAKQAPSSSPPPLLSPIAHLASNISTKPNSTVLKRKKLGLPEVIPHVSCVLGEAFHASCWLCYSAGLTARWFTCPVSDTTQSWGEIPAAAIVWLPHQNDFSSSSPACPLSSSHRRCSQGRPPIHPPLPLELLDRVDQPN